MTDPAPHAETMVQLADIANRPCSLAARAEALLATLRLAIPHRAAFLSLFEPERRCHIALARYGYSRRAEQHLDSPAFAAEIATRPSAFTDPAPRPNTYLPLYAGSGAYLGLLGMSGIGPEMRRDQVIAPLDIAAPIIARAIDPRQLLAAMASMAAGTVAGAVLTRAGQAEPLPNLPGLETSGLETLILAEARALLAAGDSHAGFLAARVPGEYAKVTVLATAGIPPGHRSGIVLVSPAGSLHGLTHHELTLLGLRVADGENPPISEHLDLTADSVLESIRAKMAAPTSDAAVVQAAAHGLYLPAPAV